jgi:hypothetical protein
MTEIKRPVFFSGENPGMTLYLPGTEQVVAVASYWHCTDSPWGIGRVLVLWLATDTTPISDIGFGGIFTDNLDLAHILVDKLTQHFPEFEEVPTQALKYVTARCGHTYDGTCYQVQCQVPNTQIEIKWCDVLDRKQIVWPSFPAGNTTYDLTTVICPCRVGHIQVNSNTVDGDVKVVKNAEGLFSSTAFLAFAETWIGP